MPDVIEQLRIYADGLEAFRTAPAQFSRTRARTRVGVLLAGAAVVVAAIGVLVVRSGPADEKVTLGAAPESTIALSPGGIWASRATTPVGAVEEFLRDGLHVEGDVLDGSASPNGPTWVTVTSPSFEDPVQVLAVPTASGWTIEQVGAQPTLILREADVGRVAVAMRRPRDGVSAQVAISRGDSTEVYTVDAGGSDDGQDLLLPVNDATEVAAIVVVWLGPSGAPVAVEGARF